MLSGFSVKGIVAILVVLGCFGLIAPYAIRDQAPDALVLAFVTGALMLVLGFYFGHVNGEATANLAASQQILTLAQQRRVTDPPASGPTTPLPPANVG